MKALLTAALAATGLAAAVLATPATAYHTTSVTIDQTALTVAPGESVSLTGVVHSECAEGASYTWALSKGGSLPTTADAFDPASGTAEGPYSYTALVPTTTAPGDYTLTVVGTMTNGPGCNVVSGDPFLSPDDPAALRPSIQVTVALPTPAGGCPAERSGYQLTFRPGDQADDNGDQYVCVKSVNGRGNRGDGTNVKDNNGPA